MKHFIQIQLWWLGVRINLLRRKYHRALERKMQGRG